MLISTVVRKNSSVIGCLFTFFFQCRWIALLVAMVNIVLWLKHQSIENLGHISSLLSPINGDFMQPQVEDVEALINHLHLFRVVMIYFILVWLLLHNNILLVYENNLLIFMSFIDYCTRNNVSFLKKKKKRRKTNGYWITKIIRQKITK